MNNTFLQETQNLQEQLVKWRRDLHQIPEVGTTLPQTVAYITKQLDEMQIDYQVYEKISCVVATIGSGEPCFMLRSDMDALPVVEEADVPFKSTNGNMHGCGHDMHTSMLLGAAMLLKKHEEEIKGTVKLVFQPAEEIFQGSLDMIKAGVLENPHVDAAVMIHVTSGMPIPAGMLMIPAGGISMSSCEQYHITITGKGGHGSTPHMAIDPITVAAQVHLALQEINSRELDPRAYGVFTTCKF